jgi:hypothetical protein
MPLMVKPAHLPDLTLSLASHITPPVLLNPALRSGEPAWLLLHEIACMRAFGLENRRMQPVRTMALGNHRRSLRMRVSGVPGTVSTSG